LVDGREPGEKEGYLLFYYQGGGKEGMLLQEKGKSDTILLKEEVNLRTAGKKRSAICYILGKGNKVEHDKVYLT